MNAIESKITITKEDIEKHRKLIEENKQKIKDSFCAELKKEWLKYKEFQEIDKFLINLQNKARYEKSDIKKSIYLGLYEKLELFLILNFFSKRETQHCKNIEEFLTQLNELKTNEKEVLNCKRALENLLHNNEIYKNSNSEFNGLISCIDVRIDLKSRKEESIQNIAIQIMKELGSGGFLTKNEFFKKKTNLIDYKKGLREIVKIYHAISYATYKMVDGEISKEDTLRWIYSFVARGDSLFQVVQTLQGEYKRKQSRITKDKLIKEFKKHNNNLKKYFYNTLKLRNDLIDNFNFSPDKNSNPAYSIYLEMKLVVNGKDCLLDEMGEFIKQNDYLFENCRIQNEHSNIKQSQKQKYDNYFQVRLIKEINTIFNSKKDYMKSRLLTNANIADFINYFNSIANKEAQICDEEYVKQITRD